MTRHVPHRLPLLFAAATVLTGSTGAIVIRNDRDLAQTVALAQPFDMTCRVAQDGCGTLIAPTWVLTAAHVAVDVSPFTAYVHFGEESYPIRRVVLHPDALDSPPGRTPRPDLALLELDRPASGITPAELYRADDELGRTVTVVGYGDFGLADGEFSSQDGVRRAATNVIDDTRNDLLIFTLDAPPNGTEMEGMGAAGDSGGPIFIMKEGRPHIAGVSSASMGGRPGHYGIRDAYARVSTFAGWIDGVLANPPASSIPLDRVFDISTHPLPDTTAGRCMKALLNALGERGVDQLAAVGRKYRGDRARAERDDRAWATIVRGFAGECGPLIPLAWTVHPRGGLLVRAKAERDGAIKIVLLLFDDRAGRMMGVDVGPG